MDNARPFAGIEVVEFGQFIAVPFCAQLLSEGGAHVIKIESVEGDPVRQLAPLAPGETRHFLSRNRGKHSLPLDLRHASAARVVKRLLARADVVLTNFRPGLAAELGLDWPSLAPRFPRLVVGNVSAFGRRGPAARLAGMDLVVQARSGLLAAGGNVNDGVPTGGENPVVDYMCAMTLAFGIASALLRRAKTGRGGEVEASLLMAALVVQNNNMVRIDSADHATHASVRARLAELRSAGRPYAEQAALTPQIRPPGTVNVYYRTYATRDAALAVACGSPALRRAFIKAVGLSDEALDRPITDRAKEVEHYVALRRKVEAIVVTRTTADWQATMEAAGVPAAGVKLPLELLDDEQALANEMLHDLTHPVLGRRRARSSASSGSRAWRWTRCWRKASRAIGCGRAAERAAGGQLREGSAVEDWRSATVMRRSIRGLRRSIVTRSARRPWTPCSSSSSTSSTSPVK
jgi:crotonobetainyl-CoA:carnitine CoA-transferase CaiB-like acyl-CoA transferase